MRTALIFVLFVALFAIVIALPTSEVEENNQALYDVNADGFEHDTVPRETRQFGFGRYGGGFGGGFGRYGGFRHHGGGFGGGFGHGFGGHGFGRRGFGRHYG